MNALPVTGSNDWLALPARDGGQLHGAAASRPWDSGPAGEIDPAHRLSLAQQGFLELRLEAALGRLAAMETLLDAERLHVRQAQTALAVAERSLERHREAIVASDRQRQEGATEIGRLKQALHQSAIDKVRYEQQIATLTTAAADRAAEIQRLNGAGATAEASLRTARMQHGSASDALHRECLRLEEVLQGERRDKQLLQRALDLARANRRALQDQLGQAPVAVPALWLAPEAPLAVSPALDAAASDSAARPQLVPDTPAIFTFGQDGLMPPSCPALTERLHAACY